MSTQKCDQISGLMPDAAEQEGSAHTNKKSYETPVLVYFGDVRDVTLGPTVGIGESGNELGFRNPP